MASSTKTKVEQDMTKHALGHIFAKLNGRRISKTTFVIVEGSDDLAFYGRFFDKRVSSLYYSTKMLSDGSIKPGGCKELMAIVNKVLQDGRTTKVIGIMDTDYRKYIDGYSYPKNVFHTDHRDMEMTALCTHSVHTRLRGWIQDYDNRLGALEPMLRHIGEHRILNDKYGLGCSFRKHAKINLVYNEIEHRCYPHWKARFNKGFIKGCLKKECKNTQERAMLLPNLGKALLFRMFHSYQREDFYDICRGHDVLRFLSWSHVDTATYSPDNIWEKCFDAYTMADFKRTRLFADIQGWERNNEVSLFKKG